MTGENEVDKKHEQLMLQGRGVEVLLKGHDTAAMRGELRIQEWDKRERTARAVKFWVYCWAFALVSVALPLLHFVLVPGLLLAGPIAAFIVIGQEAVVLGGRGTCPHCQKTMKIVRNDLQFPLSDRCEHCQKDVKIELG